MSLTITERADGKHRINNSGRWLKPITVWRRVRSMYAVKVTGPHAVSGTITKYDGSSEPYLAEWYGWSRGYDAEARAEVSANYGREVVA